MAAKDQYLELRYAGDKGPEDFEAGDVAGVLKSFETLVKSSLRDEESIDPSELVIGLVDVEDGSNGLLFRSRYMKACLTVLSFIGQTVTSGEFDKLDGTQRECLRSLQKVGKKYNSPAEISTREGDRREVHGTVKTDTKIPESPKVHGTTTIYGKVEKVGGKLTTPPTVHVRVGDYQKVIVTVGEARARELAGQLYENIGLRGTAVWIAETGEIKDFELDEIVDYSGDMSTGLDKLSEAVGSSFNEVDPNEYVRKVRGRNDTSELNDV